MVAPRANRVRRRKGKEEGVSGGRESTRRGTEEKEICSQARIKKVGSVVNNLVRG